MKIILCCSAGMSTSMLASKMAKARPDDIIEAITVDEVEQGLPEDTAVVLLGPQMRFKEAEIKKITSVPVAVIPMQDYGLGNVDNVFKLVDSLTTI